MMSDLEASGAMRLFDIESLSAAPQATLRTHIADGSRAYSSITHVSFVIRVFWVARSRRKPTCKSEAAPPPLLAVAVEPTVLIPAEGEARVPLGRCSVCHVSHPADNDVTTGRLPTGASRTGRDSNETGDSFFDHPRHAPHLRRR